MSELYEKDVKTIAVATLARRHELRADDIDGMVLGAIATPLTSSGIEEEARTELRADFQHLRRWRKGVEQAQSFAFKAAIAVIVSGVLGAGRLGVKVMVGK